ncbi:MAG: polysaccharide biosynthesis/export family protein [Pseudomonadota bacterium]
MSINIKSIAQYVLFSLFLGLAAACQSTPAAPAPQTAPQQADLNVGDYRLGPADRLRITVFGHDDLSGEFSVASNGTISFPLIGDIQASGLTVTEFQKQTEDSLSQGYLKSPRVTAEVMTFRPFYILGEVRKPGEYQYTNRLTVMNAIATAEGFTHRANKRQIAIRGWNDTEERRVELTPNTLIQPGDTIRVLERLF